MTRLEPIHAFGKRCLSMSHFVVVCLERCAPSPRWADLSRPPPSSKAALSASPLAMKPSIASKVAILTLRDVETNIDMVIIGNYPRSLFLQSSSIATSEARLETWRVAHGGPWAELRLRNLEFSFLFLDMMHGWFPMIQPVAKLTFFPQK
jgi:hypothetical protein